MEEQAQTLKRCFTGISTSSLNERKHIILTILVPCIQHADLSEGQLKGVSKIFSVTAFRYSDHTSENLVIHALKVFLSTHGSKAAKPIISEVVNLSAQLKKTGFSKPLAKVALNLLRWCKIIVEVVNKSLDKDDVEALVHAKVLLTSRVFSSGSKNLAKKGFKLLSKLWGAFPDVLEKSLEKAAVLNQPESLCFAGVCFWYLSEKKELNKADDKKVLLFDAYLNQFIICKAAPHLEYMHGIKYLLKHVGHEEFKKNVLPSIKKALLRNPEAVLESVSCLLSHLNIDLSQYAEDLGKSLSGHLIGQQDGLRACAASSLGNVAKQCSDPDAVSKLIDMLTELLYGSEGKLTKVEQRCSVIDALSLINCNAVSGKSAKERLATQMYDKMQKFLEQEGHEGTLCSALKMLKLWASQITNEVPSNFPEVLKRGLNAKNSTCMVRSLYLQFASSMYKGNTLSAAIPLVDTFFQLFEKESGQSALAPAVTEALSAAVNLINIATLDDVSKSSKIQSFWTLVLNEEKCSFTLERFISSGSELGLEQLLIFISALFSNHSNQLTEKTSRPWYRALVHLLLHHNWKTRAAGKKVWKTVLHSAHAEPSSVQMAVLEEFHSILVTHKVQPASEKDNSVEIPAQSLNSKSLLEALKTIVFALNSLTSEEKESICLRVLIDACHPAVVQCDTDLWGKILLSFGVDPLELVDKHKDDLLAIVEGDTDISEAQSSALATVLKSAPETLASDVVSKCLKVFEEPALYSVTQTEYLIMQTPEGELYDKTILETAKSMVESKNIKRESKAYSFKEQKLDLELKEELKKKKGDTKTEDVPKLTKKQQEMLEDQRRSEKEIRDRLTKVYRHFKKYVTMMKVSMRAIPHQMAMHCLEISNSLINLMNSPLAAAPVVSLFLDLRRCVFDVDYRHLGDLVAYVTLRLLQPACQVDENWCAEDLYKETARTVEVLLSFVTTRNVPVMMTYTEKKLFSSTAFAYCLPLMRAVLSQRGTQVKGDEKLRLDVLKFVSLHSQERVSMDNAEEESVVLHFKENAKLLPRKEMLSILSGAILDVEGYNKEAKIQREAAQTLVEVCKSASGANVEADVQILHLLGRNLMSASSTLRHSSLEGLQCLVALFPSDGTDERESLTSKILLAKYDVEEKTRDLAEIIWAEADLFVSPNVSTELLRDIVIPLESVRVAASSALALALETYPGMTAIIRDQLLEMYEENNKIPLPVFDNLGRISSAPFVDKWEARAGIAMSLGKIADFIESEEISELFNFFVPGALGDRNEAVRRLMLEAAMAAINAHGKENINELLKIFDEFLATAGQTSSHDIIRQSVIILMGSLAKHLDKTDPKIRPIVEKLMDSLSTPSQQVQEAVASCLAPLCSAIKEDAPSHIKRLMDTLFNAEKYGDRRGGAYGLAGMVKGLGILSLKQHDIIGTLTTSIQDKKNYKHREGALFAFETLCNMLGRLFEPYVVQLLPHLLLCFGDGNQYVREAADETAKAVMRNLSAHGVKLVLPSLLKALEEDSWRTKTGSIELLGAMAYCAPKQLSSCLPSVVPKLTEVLADSHVKVQKAGQQALKQIGSVVRNPEIQEISPIILAALADPGKNTVPCLQSLLSTSFVHFIDAPSLALIMPILEKANVQRSTETKKMSAQIIGNMYALTDQKDLAPYLPAVIPGLKKSLLDPSPEVRGVSARALGAMVKGMGEDSFSDLLPWLMETLTSEQSSVDRSGAAQGLAEVLHGLGTERLEKLMPDVIKTTSKEDLAPHVREGYLMLYIYLPATFGSDFAKYVGPIVPSLLKGLSDESEFVRATSLKAGQRIISAYADTALSLFLPELDKGLFDDNWRIRFSSIQLLGDLLFRVTGVSGKMTTHGDEDDNFGTAHSTKAIIELLGLERRNRVLAGLYMGRSDIAVSVRQASLHVWKVVVHNTAKTLREILPTLFSLLLGCLASESYDKRQTAGRTLGDIVRKLGERVLPEIIPILEKGLDSGRDDERQGVCIGISEIVKSTSRDMIVMFEDSLVLTIRKALLDPLPDVRAAAADAFDKLHDTIGQKALDGTLPFVLQKLNDSDYTERALDGLRNVMAVKSRIVLPFLVPKLTTPPVNTRALAILSTVAGDSMTRHLSRIIPAMFQAIDKSPDSEQQEQAIEGTKALILSVESNNGMTSIVDEFIESSRHSSPGVRKASAIIMKAFCSGCKTDYSDYVQQLLKVILQLMNDADQGVYTEAWGALDALIKRLDPAEQMQHIGNLRKAIQYAAEDAREGIIPGFCIVGKGINAIYPVYKEGILNGGPDLKEQTAKLLGEVVVLTTSEALKAALPNVTGPLIRIFADRFNWNVKVAILNTLALLLKKVGIMLKPFLPQLQTTFIKALNDKTLAVRDKASEALTLLTTLHTKVDSLFTELRNSIKNNEDTTIRESILKALRSVILIAGSKMSEAVRGSLVATLVPLLGSAEDDVRVGAGGAVGALCIVLSNFELNDLLNNELLDTNESMDWTVRHGRTVALSYAIFDAPQKLNEVAGNDVIAKTVLKQATADRIPITIYGVHSLGHVMIANAICKQAIAAGILETFKKSLQHSSNDVRLAAVKTIDYVARRVPGLLDSNVSSALLHELMACCKDRNTSIKAMSEFALISFLSLRDGDQKYEELLEVLPNDVSERLAEFRRVTLNKLLQSCETREDYPFEAPKEQN